jgi:hypothetical protein
MEYIMTNFNRTTQKFLSDKAKGQRTEKEFMDRIALMGGSAISLGTVPTRADPTPRFSKPDNKTDDGFSYSVSPDIVFTLPNQPSGFTSLAQVKVKKIQTGSSKEEPYILLDEKELHRMNEANRFFDIIFVVHLPELKDTFHEWLFVSVGDLKPETTTLIKRQIMGKPTFLLPLTLFQPIYQLRKKVYEPANADVAPTATTTRNGDNS